MKSLVKYIIRFYQKFLSFDTGLLRFLSPTGCCRYSQSCSEYTYQMVDKRGVLPGLGLGFKRILTCNPFNNMGWGVIAFTGFLTLLLSPVTTPFMKNMQKMKEIAPELEKLKKKYKNDKTKLMQAQADFYKARGVSPAAGCLPQVVQIIVLIALFRGFINVFGSGGDPTAKLNEFLYPQLHLNETVNIGFFGRDVTKPDVINISGLPFAAPGVFLILAAAFQFLSSYLSTPTVTRAQKAASKTSGGTDDFAASMQKQMLYFFPIMTIFIGYSFPLVLVLYWGSLSIFQTLQRFMILGFPKWGALNPLSGLIKYPKN